NRADDADTSDGEHERKQLWIRRLKTDTPVRFPEDPLHGDATLEFDDGGLPVASGLARLDDEIVTVPDALVRHDRAADAKREHPATVPEGRSEVDPARDRARLHRPIDRRRTGESQRSRAGNARHARGDDRGREPMSSSHARRDTPRNRSAARRAGPTP